MALSLYRVVNLSGISEGWDNKAFMRFKPLSPKQRDQAKKAKGKLTQKQIQKDPVKSVEMAEIAKQAILDNFVNGKVYHDGNDGLVLEDAVVDDVDVLIELVPGRFFNNVIAGDDEAPAPTKKS